MAEEASTATLLLLPMFLCSLVFFIWLRKKKTAQRHRKVVNLPPGPKGLPFIGNFHQLQPTLHRTYCEFSKKYGPIVHLSLAGVSVVVVSSAETAIEVLKTQDLSFCSRPRLISLNKFSYGGLDVAFAPYGEQWRELRRIFVGELFSNKKILFFRTVMEKEIARAILSIEKKLDNDGNGRTEIDLGEILQNLSITLMCQMAFGKLVGEEDGKMKEFHETIEEFNSLGFALFAEDFFSGGGTAVAARAIDRLRGLHQRLEKAAAKLDRFFEDVIEEHKIRRRKQEDEAGDWVERDIVDVLLRLHNERPLGFTTNHIKAALMNVFIAGIDTTAATATWAMAELVNNPRVMNTVYEELTASTFLEKKKDKEKAVLVNEEDLVNLHYLKLVVKETLRLHPPVPLLVPRQCTKATQIDGYDVLPGTRVFVNAWAMGRDPKYWENPDEFSPERFAGKDDGFSVDYKGQHFHYLPFGGGRRICPGMQLGAVMLEVELANFLSAFKWEVPDGVKGEVVDMEEAFGIAISKKKPLILNASKRF